MKRYVASNLTIFATKVSLCPGKTPSLEAQLSRYEVTRGFVILQYHLYKVLPETRARICSQYGGLLENSARCSTV